MFKAMNKYYEINFDKILELKEIIVNENIEITCVNSNGISIIVPGSSVNLLIEEKDNILLKGTKYYISSFSSKFINLNNPQTKIGGTPFGAPRKPFKQAGLYTKSSRMGVKISRSTPASRQVHPWTTPSSLSMVSPARTVRVSPSMVKRNTPDTT